MPSLVPSLVRQNSEINAKSLLVCNITLTALLRLLLFFAFFARGEKLFATFSYQYQSWAFWDLLFCSAFQIASTIELFLGQAY